MSAVTDRVVRAAVVLGLAAASAPTRLRAKGGRLRRLGSEYGGWWVPTEMPAENSVAYCVGAGEDISFDLALLESGWIVRTFDPTPKAVAYVEGLHVSSERFRFLPVALWSAPTTLRFFAPRDPLHVSHSAVNLQGTVTFAEVPADSLDGLRARVGDSDLDLLKLDIEGAEHEVIRSLPLMNRLPSVLCVEFDAFQVRSVFRSVQLLRSLGYRLVRSERLNTLFVRVVEATHAS